MQRYKRNTGFILLFWAFYFLYEWLGNAAVGSEYKRYAINAAVIVPITFGATWFTVHVLIERFFLKGKRTTFWILFGVSAVVFTLMRRAFNYYYTYPLYYPEGQQTMSFLFPPKLIIEAVNTYLIVALYAMFYFLRAWYEQQRTTQQLQKDKAEAQLELLKSQVQPHFIFNTLNNIYSYAQQNNQQTSELIYRLSALLSYMLYDSRETAISLSKELEYINNYIELEKIRYGKRLDVSLNVFDPVDHFKIAPLLLLPLIENSFKHGVSNNIRDGWIRMDIALKDGWLSVKIENSCDEHSNGNGSSKNGIGLENVKKRLDILYQDNYEFKCIRENDSFLTILKIKKDENSTVHDH
ncbi:histidine kinase [uncultured Chitinophaga sp.]|jgi:Putative regulator of cell autolysis|uniref:sensor histidine kinase n=1 Tax=uncultured Chitinophaga sp. TaxID=339340 RepID=UPI00261061DF|nr:histidine kinase [uncultured Chitinophaga sp.]